jgi:hypothetical protein
MAIQASSQGNLQLILNLVQGEYFRDLDVDLIFFCLLKLILKFPSVLLRPRNYLGFHKTAVIIFLKSCDLAFSDRIFLIVFNLYHVFQVIWTVISSNFNRLLRYHIINAIISILIDKDVMKLVLEDVYK